MNEEKLVLGQVKAAIFDLPAVEQERVKVCAKKLREEIEEEGPHGVLALALVSAEWAAKS